MKIKTQFLINVVSFSIILIIVGASVALTQDQIANFNNQEAIANDIQTGASNLNYISNNYFLYQDSSYISLWQSESSMLSNKLSVLNSTNLQQQTQVNTVSGDIANLNAVFASITSLLGNASGNVNIRIQPNFQAQWDRMSVQVQALAFDSQRLSQIVKDQTDQVIFLNTVFTVALLVSFGVFFITSYALISRRTLRSISKLEKGIGVIGAGNLNYIVEAGKNDEIAGISKSVNQMTTNLKTITASKTDLEATQASLRESEQRWATTLASIGDAVIATDTSGKIMYLNGEAEELTGWKLSEASQKPVKEVFNIVNEQTRLEVENPIDKVLREGIVVGLANHTVLIQKNGAEVPIDDSGAPIKDKDGNTTGVVLIFRNITERKKAEEALQAAMQQSDFERKRLESILETSPSAIVVIEAPDGRFSLVNKRAQELYGIDFRGVDLATNVARVKASRPDGTTYAVNEVPASRALNLGEEVRNEEMIIYRADGTAIPVIVSAGPIRDAQGNIAAAIVIFEDITERKRLEEETKRLLGAVQQERDRLSSLLNSITDEVWFADTEKKFTLANPSAVKEFKLASSAEGVDVENLAEGLEVLRPDGSPRPVEEAPPLRALKGEFVKNQEETIRTPVKGELRTRQVSAAPVRDSTGAIIGSVSVVRDITDQKKAQDALKENEHLYHTVFDNSQDGFQLIELMYDEHGKPFDHKFLKVNHAYEEIIGVKAEDILDKTARYISPNDEPHWFEVPDRVIKTGKSEHVELYNKDINKWLDCFYFLYSKNVVGTLFRDITKRKQLEKQLQDSERLTAIGATAGMVGHDIRNPLQAITSDVYLAKLELASVPDAECKTNALESLTEIEKNVSYINKIVQDLQDYARPLNPVAKEIDLQNLIGDLIKKNGIPVEIKVSVKVQKEAASIVADPEIIRRVLANLVTNAVQAMPEGGKLDVRASKEVDDTVITVQDTGVGIPEEARAKLFTPLFTTKSKGQGFGLVVVKRMVEAMNGTVTFETETGKGTKFIIRLPPPKEMNGKHVFK